MSAVRTSPRRALPARLALGLATVAAGLVAATAAPLAHAASVPVGTIRTVLGTRGENGPAAGALIFDPLVATDAAGNVFVSNDNQIQRIDITTGIITNIAGNGDAAFAGDGGPALAAGMAAAQVAVASNGDIYFGDSDNKRVRKITTDGIISTVAGNGVAAFAGDTGPATSASVQSATGIALDGLGNLFIADPAGNRIRKVVLATGIITTIAGTGLSTFNGDNQPATAANLAFPYALTVDPSNNLYVTERNGNRIRKIDTGGTITTVAGTGLAPFNGDGPAATTNLNSPGVLQFTNGGIDFTEPGNNRARRVDLTLATVTTIAGTGVNGTTGDGGAALAATLDLPFGLAVGPTGTVYIGDEAGHVRSVDTGGTIQNFAGVGAPFAGDGGPGTSAIISGVPHLATDRVGNVYVGDALNSRVRKLNVASGIVTTIAGTGNPSFNGDGPAATTNVYPDAIAVDAAGNVYIADTYNGRIRKLTVATGMITTIAGTGDTSSNGDGPALTTNIFPNNIAFDANGDLLFVDYLNIRKLTFATGSITTIAGTIDSTFNGDGAVGTTNIQPTALTVAPNGDVYFAEQLHNRVRKLTLAAGTITTLAGTGTAAFNGDGPALTTDVGPTDVTLAPNGDLYIADPANNRIRLFHAADQTLTTIAGSSPGFAGDGGPATAALLRYPERVVLDGFGNLYVADSANFRVRSIRLDGAAPTPPVYQPVVPERLLDTRIGLGAPAVKLAGGTTLTLQVTGAGQTAIPADAAAVVLNVTVTAPNADGYLTVWPCGSPAPLASNLNYYKADDTIANLVIAKVGANGTVCITSQSTTHVVADINGWFPAGAAYNPVTPERLVDTRNGTGAPAAMLAADDTLTVQITGAGQTKVPADASAVVVNVTVTQPGAGGYLTVWPCGQPKPLASNLNYAPNQTIPNLVISRLASGGTICITSQHSTHVVVDVNGWFPAGADFMSFYPERLLDTRHGVGAPQGKLAADGVLALRVTGVGATKVPVDASAVAVNITVTAPVSDGFLTVWPCGTPRPLASNVNYSTGQTIPNLVITKVGANGSICISGQVDLHVVADITGWF